MRMTYLHLSVLILLGPMVHAIGQTPSPVGDWGGLKTLPAHARVHVAGDRQSRVCVIDLVDDEKLQCSKGRSQYSFERAEVKSVKLTRYGRSTVAGLGIGLGTGMAIGALAGHAQETPGDWFHGLPTAIGVVFGGAVGGIAGGVIGGPTDFLRGPVVYRRQ